jgi:hypothetical protein
LTPNAAHASPAVVAQPSADETGPQPVVAQDDLTQARAMPLPTEEQIPSPPTGYRPPSVEERRRVLRLLDEEHVAEAILALQDLAAKGPKALADDLGPAAADVQGPGRVASELVVIDRLLTKLSRVTEFLTTRRAIAASDAVVMLESVAEELDHRAKRDPHVRDRYAPTFKVMASRSAKISEGPAAAKAARAAKKPA